MNENHKLISAITLCGWVLLSFFILSSPDCFIEAEYVYYLNLYSSDSHFSYEFIKNYKGTAGILSTWFHVLTHPLTKGDIMLMRVTNIFWLFLTAFFLNKIIKRENLTTYKYPGFLIIFFPSIFILSGRNMGDFPALFMAVLFYYLIRKIKDGKREIYWYIMAGLAGSLAIVGKQTLIFLLVFPAYLFLKDTDKRLKLAVLFFFMLLLPAVLYFIWGSILPESSTFKLEVFSLAYMDFFYVFVYAFCMGVITDTDFVKLFVKKQFMLQSLFVICLILIFTIPIYFPFFKSTLLKIRNSDWFFLFDYGWKFFWVFMAVSGFRYIFYYSRKNLEGWAYADLVTFLALFFLIFLKLPVYTGRYLAMVSPFIFLLTLGIKRRGFPIAGLLSGLLYNVFDIITLYNPEILFKAHRLMVGFF